MNLPPALRLALVPIGVAIAHKGLSYLTEEADRLGAEVDARRAELAAPSHHPECDGVREHSDRETGELTCACGLSEPAAPEDLPPSAENSRPPAGKSPARTVGALVANVAAFGLGAYLSIRARRWLQERAAAELAVTELVLTDLPKPAPGTCGIYPAFGDPPTPCTLPYGHPTFLHSWEGGTGDPDQDNPAAFVHPGPCDLEDCTTCRRIRKQ